MPCCCWPASRCPGWRCSWDGTGAPGTADADPPSCGHGPRHDSASALLDRRVLRHELALAAVRGEAHDDDAAGLEADHDAVAEGCVGDGVAHAVLGARRPGLRARA